MNYKPYADLKKMADYYYSQGQKDLAADYTIKYADKMSEAYRAGSRTSEAILMAFGGYADATDNLFVLKDARTHDYAVETINVIQEVLARDPDNPAPKWQFIKSTAIMLIRGWKYSEKNAWVFKRADTYINDIYRDAPQLFRGEMGRFYVDFYEQLRDKTKKEYNDKLVAERARQEKLRQEREQRERDAFWEKYEEYKENTKRYETARKQAQSTFFSNKTNSLYELKKEFIQVTAGGLINFLLLFLVFLSPISIIHVWHSLHWWSIILYILGIIVVLVLPLPLGDYLSDDVIKRISIAYTGSIYTSSASTSPSGLVLHEDDIWVHYGILSYGLIAYTGLCIALVSICRHLGSVWSYIGLTLIGIIVCSATIAAIVYYVGIIIRLKKELKKYGIL